ncbi:MAG: hypothetical protein PWQ79_2202, partial [Thermococcaceae archaeon]|nr:hypothetical protein [Thermococcaceae archaeon]
MSLQEFYKYARDYMEPKNESARRRFWELVDFFESLSLPKGGRILDLCAGTGIVGAALAKATNAEVLTVLDARAEDLARVNAWLEFGNIGLDVTVVRGDVREIPKLVGE